MTFSTDRIGITMCLLGQHRLASHVYLALAGKLLTFKSNSFVNLMSILETQTWPTNADESGTVAS